MESTNHIFKRYAASQRYSNRRRTSFERIKHNRKEFLIVLLATFCVVVPFIIIHVLGRG
jgi:hypothetical protein